LQCINFRYVNTANELLKGEPSFANLTPEKMIQDRKVRASNPSLFNNVAQAWNHAFYWKCLTPKGGGTPSGLLMQMIDRDFGSFDEFRKKMENEALTCFGSGWAWLGYENKGQGKLIVMKVSIVHMQQVLNIRCTFI
jgi:Fe-Mn family superoxide dismutase